MCRFVAVIDLGKTNSKVVLVDTQTAEEVHVITQPAALNTASYYPSIDNRAIKHFVIDSLASLVKKYVVDAITVTTHGATVALIDACGELAMPVLDYEFQEIDALRPSYNKHRPPFSETGSPALPGGLNIGAQLFWQQSNYPQQFAKTKTILTWPQYWVYMLTGECHNDVTSLGCHSDLYEPRKQRYSSLVTAMDWDSLLPPVKHSGQLSAALRPSIVKQLGLSKAVPVYTGIHDSNASLVPHLLSQQTPFSVVSTGTWFISMAIGGSSVQLDEKKDTLLNVSALGECVPSARFMGGRERDLLIKSSKACEQSLVKLLSSHSQPAMLMPSMVPGTGPFPEANSNWVGACTENDHAVRDSAVSLYLALMTNESMRTIGCVGPTYIEGPLAHDDQFAQMLAAVSGDVVFISEAQTGTSVGASMLIAKPVKPLVYEEVKLNSPRRDDLVRYAQLWQRQLASHAM